MRLRYPPASHCDVEPDDRCPDHGQEPGWLPVVGRRPWVVTGLVHVVDERHKRRDWGLEPGTVLRLDAMAVGWAPPPQGGPEWWRFDVHTLRQRFTVMSGPMRGTCWEARHATGDVHLSHSDPVAPMHAEAAMDGARRRAWA